MFGCLSNQSAGANPITILRICGPLPLAAVVVVLLIAALQGWFRISNSAIPVVTSTRQARIVA